MVFDFSIRSLIDVLWIQWRREKRLFRIDYTIQGAARRSLNLENAANLLLGTGIEFQADYWFRSFEYCCGSLNIAIMELYYNSEDIYIYVFQIGKIILIYDNIGRFIKFEYHLNLFSCYKDILLIVFFFQLNSQIFGIKRLKPRINVRESIRDVRVR